ncbi:MULTISPECIES: hypothetical protein [unclassified Sphingomonas]|uniref:hypothetical protein n=1 Tax=unclassified Sphingomonas TaxID=196159 RepID=UPI000288C408|nr:MULTISPECIES: hypothetical protein [unclassified Sphingomonas]
MKAIFWTSVALALSMPVAAGAQEVVQWSAPAAMTGQTAFFPLGTALHLTTRTELNTKERHAGDRFYLEVAEPLVYRGQVVIPAGAVAVGEVMRAERNGHFGKRGTIDVRLSYVQTPSGPVRISGRTSRNGTGQGLLSIGGALVVSWPMMFIHGTSGRLPADTPITAYLADDLRFTVQSDGGQAVAALPDSPGQMQRALPARFDPSVFSSSQR